VLAEAVNDPKKLPWLIVIPGLWIALLAFITMTAGETMTKLFGLFGISWSHAHEGAAHVIAQADFFSTWFVDLTFVPTAGAVTLIFFLGLKRFLNDIHENALLEGKTDQKTIDYKAFFQALLRVLPVVLRHDKFNECEANKDRATPHMMVLFSFIGLAIVTGTFFVVLYLFQTPGPYSQLNPVKWLANISGVALIIGASLMIKNRLDNKDQVSSYKDWYILGVVLALGLTGMITEMARLAHLEYTSYFFYYLHLIAILNLFAFLPFSKMAHLVYRLTAMTYAEYGNRK
jgi:quinone-modifying oxidoreductase subunit QmoC